MKRPYLFHWVLMVLALTLPLAATAERKVGEKAHDFVLPTLNDQTVRLSELSSNSPVVLIVLRGWPGYQCPLCTAQVQDFISSAAEIRAAGARVIMVYPGPSAALKDHAKEFLNSSQWPKEFLFVIDPDYKTINAYGLRWNAAGETSYPSTFILDRQGTIRFARISHSHGGRTTANEIVTELKRLPSN